MTNTNVAANDTAEITAVARGTTYEGAEWRVHRFAHNFTVTRTLNAGKRGKACERFTASLPFGEDEARMDALAPSITWAVREGVSVDTMRGLMADMVLAGLSFTESTVRGVDVPRGVAIDIAADLVRGRFTETEGVVTFTAIHGTPSGGSFRQDTTLGAHSKRDAAKLYQWVLANRVRLVNMTITQFRAEMHKIGAIVN
jgi:hypothetical protein